MADPNITNQMYDSQGRGPRQFPQLQGLVDIASRVRQGFLDKTKNINQFNDELKEKIRALDALSVGILAKIQELCKKALNVNVIINEKTTEIAEINQRLAQITQEQAQSAQKIQQLTEELSRAKSDSSQSGSLREEINSLKGKIQNQTSEIEILTKGIDDANGVIGQAVTELNKPHDTAELQALLGQLEGRISEINTASDCANNSRPPQAPGAPGSGTGSGTAAEPNLPRPAPLNRGMSSILGNGKGDSGFINGFFGPKKTRISPDIMFQPQNGGKRKTKRGGYKYRTTRKTRIVSSSSRRQKSSVGKGGGKRRTRGIKALIV